MHPRGLTPKPLSCQAGMPPARANSQKTVGSADVPFLIQVGIAPRPPAATWASDR